MAQRVRVDTLVETGASRRFLARQPDYFGIDRVRGRMPAAAREEPHLGLQPAPVLAQGFQQEGAEPDDPCGPCRLERE